MRKAQKASTKEGSDNSFEVIAREWFVRKKSSWSETHSHRIMQLLERDIFPRIGVKPIASLTAPALLAVARRIESRGAVETAHRALQNIGQVFRYAIATGRVERDPTGDLRGALSTVVHGHLPSITEPKEVGALLRAFDGFKGTSVVKAALLLSPYVFVRPGELRHARWADIDLDAGVWSFNASKARTGQTNEHLVPLACQSAFKRDPISASNRDPFGRLSW